MSTVFTSIITFKQTHVVILSECQLPMALSLSSQGLKEINYWIKTWENSNPALETLRRSVISKISPEVLHFFFSSTTKKAVKSYKKTVIRNDTCYIPHKPVGSYYSSGNKPIFICNFTKSKGLGPLLEILI